jgi:hypothetical protein
MLTRFCTDLYNRVWDEADYVIPPAENGAFFVATNVIVTPNQTRGIRGLIFLNLNKADPTKANLT